MKKRFIATMIILTFVLSNYGFSATRTYQKVTRKNVKVVPKSEIQTTYKDITDLNTNTAPAKPPLQEEPKKETEPEETITQAPEQKKPEPPISPDLPALQFGIRTGAIAPAFGIIADATVLPVALSETVALFSRVSVGMAQERSASSTVAYINELIRFKNQNNPIAFYAGAGINIPFATGASTGFNIVLGVERKLSFLGMKDEAVFLETGLNSFKSDDTNNSLINFLGGYMFSF